MNVQCPPLAADGKFPAIHAYGGVPGAANVSPPIWWSDVPPGTGSFLITVIDRHPVAHNWLHWCVVNVASSVRGFPAGASGNPAVLPAGSTELVNSFGKTGYGGPMPPRGSGAHEYVITVRALSLEKVEVASDSTIEQLNRRVAGCTLATATVVGIFER